MTVNKPIILTAINDNAKAWFDLLIPFLISLRETEYKGDIGVISYGLSEEKQHILRTQGVLVFQAARAINDLSIDRYMSVCQIVEQHPEYDSLALYDGDIWFPNPKFDVFAEFADQQKIYAAPDIWNCEYIYTPVKAYGAQRLNQQMRDLMAKYTYTFQAGLVGGGPQAWRGFGEFISKTLYGDQFQLVYGIDTTLLNLYAVEGGVNVLNKRFNCIPRWGYRLEENGTFTIDGELVDGLHLTGDSRYIKAWSYRYRQQAKYLDQGVALSPEHRSQKPAIVSTFITSDPMKSATHLNTLRVAEALTSHEVSIKRDLGGVFVSADDVVIDVQGDTDILLTADQAQDFGVMWLPQVDRAEPLQVSLHINGTRYDISPNGVYGISLSANDHVRLQTRHLHQSIAHVRWVLKKAKLTTQ